MYKYIPHVPWVQAEDLQREIDMLLTGIDFIKGFFTLTVDLVRGPLVQMPCQFVHVDGAKHGTLTPRMRVQIWSIQPWRPDL